MARWQPIEHQKITATGSTGGTPANFEGGIQQLYVTSDVDVTLAFDTPAVFNSEGIMIKANYPPARFEVKAANPQNIYVVSGGATASVLLMGVRGS